MYTFRMKDKIIELNSDTELMGVVNITPDSFCDSGRYIDKYAAIDHVLKMVENGASIIDIGGESSRPNSLPVSGKEELNRILPVLRALKGKLSVPVSVDTYKSQVASVALEEGADIINDISALRFDKELPDLIAKHKAGVILMHMKGSPRNMQDNPQYGNVVDEITSFLKERVEFALSAGISKESIMIDPGIGFGKNLHHNLSIFKGIDHFKNLDLPLLIGPSRKTFIGQITGKGVCERIFGTAGVIAYCALKGVNVIRVHDVTQMKDVVALVKAIDKSEI
ncbi:dihydropteroate synthase [bacterium]|nr:dihydropteroate synthase [bacterium]